MDFRLRRRTLILVRRRSSFSISLTGRLMIAGALCAALSGLGDNPALATAVTLMAAGIIAQLSFWVARRVPRQTVQPAL
ncbi:hypothetical protein ABDK09_11100 [Vibrio sp. CDRSL-10 TSBA]